MDYKDSILSHHGMVDVIKKRFRTIVNKLKYIDSWFWCRYTLNPYNGCEHASVY
ncbi:hypothetical protein GF325_00495, partial [Candidatus Bathyarchaeota archaeon]|nr:hypothetical protein [Candidatus Bathyarchaeota archaeon]